MGVNNATKTHDPLWVGQLILGQDIPPWSSAVGPRQGIILLAEEAGNGEGINEFADIFGGRFMGDLVAML